MKHKWKFIYEEESHLPSACVAFAVITNGSDTLFLHIVPDEEGREICRIYSSLVCMIEQDEEEASFQWTPENERKMLSALDSVKDDHDRISGENNILYELFNNNKQ